MSVLRSAIARSASRRRVFRADTTLNVVTVICVGRGRVGSVTGISVSAGPCVRAGGKAGCAGCGGGIGFHAGRGTGGRGSAGVWAVSVFVVSR